MTPLTSDYLKPPWMRRWKTQPTVSVVLSCRTASDRFEEALDVLVPQCEHARAELIAITMLSESRLAELRRTRRGVRVVPAPIGANIVERRMMGMAAATGDIVAMIDEGAVPDETFIDRLVARYRGEEQ